jgi:hypothetical protein
LPARELHFAAAVVFASRVVSAALAAALLVGTGASLGCAGAIRSASVDASRAAVPVVVDQALGSFEDPANRERVEQILGTPEMQRAIQETSRAVVIGALEPATGDRIQGVTAEMTRTVADVLAEQLRDQLIPASIEGLRAAVRAEAPEASKGLAAALREAVAQATKTAIDSAARELPGTLAPAVRASIVESLEAPDLRASVTGIASDATRAALLASRDVLVDLHEHEEGEGPIARMIDRVQRMVLAAIVATFCVGALVGGLVVFALRFRRGPGRGPPTSASPLGRGARDEPSTTRLDPTPTRAS